MRLSTDLIVYVSKLTVDHQNHSRSLNGEDEGRREGRAFNSSPLLRPFGHFKTPVSATSNTTLPTQDPGVLISILHKGHREAGCLDPVSRTLTYRRLESSPYF